MQRIFRDGPDRHPVSANLHRGHIQDRRIHVIHRYEHRRKNNVVDGRHSSRKFSAVGVDVDDALSIRADDSVDRKMKKQAGFTLIELMVTVSIVVLLLTWGVPSYSKWKKKHDVENQVVQLYSDLQFARMNAYTSKVITGLWWGSATSITSYSIRFDSDNDGTIDKNLQTVNPYSAITYSVSGGGTPTSVDFDTRGFGPATNSVTFSVAPNQGASVDCVVASYTRITLGKMSGTTCVQK
jgi:type IV fimbrial biogenesis protein FimT